MPNDRRKSRGGGDAPGGGPPADVSEADGGHRRGRTHTSTFAAVDRKGNRPFLSGYVALFGRPNTGKTTLLNRLCGAKLGIVTPKPQTTRSRIVGVRTGKQTQMIFLDTPGFVASQRYSKLDERIQACAIDGLNDADLVIAFFDATRHLGEEDQQIAQTVTKLATQTLVVLNKIDIADSAKIEERRQQILKILPGAAIALISAETGMGLVSLLRAIRRRLPAGPLYFPEETLTDQSYRFLAAEVVREQIFLQLDQEAPYGCAVVVTAYKEEAQSVNIEANIIVERDSLKGLVLGKGGSRIKALGTLARQEIGKQLEKTVNLKLFVKVEKDWRKSEKLIKQFGY